MNTLALLFSLTGLFVTLGSIALYLRTIPRGTVPEKVGEFASWLGVGMAVSAMAIYFAVSGHSRVGFYVYLFAGSGFVIGLFVLWILTQRKTPVGDLKVKAGDKPLPFSAITSDGAAFDSGELKGKRTLLKFFRGGWCPYCLAELIAFSAMTEELAEYDVSVVALSKDTPDEAALHKARDGLEFRLLCDPELKVIRSYGVEHHKAFGQTRNPKSVFAGALLGFAPVSFQTMAIPTTLLIDEEGVIRWTDQSEDYRLRSNTKRVMEAVRSVFA